MNVMNVRKAADNFCLKNYQLSSINCQLFYNFISVKQLTVDS